MYKRQTVKSQATAVSANSYPMEPGVTRAVTRSQVSSPNAADKRGNRNNRAALARLFEQDTLQHLHKLWPSTSLDISYQLDGALFSMTYAYATTNTQGSLSEGGINGKNPEHVQGAYGPTTSGVLESHHVTQRPQTLSSTPCTSWYQSPQSWQGREF